MKFHALLACSAWYANQNKLALRYEHLFPIIMSLKRKRSVLSIEDKQSIILRLEKGEKGTNLSAEYAVSKQQISDIRKNKEKIMKFADNLETSEGLKRKSLKVAHDEQLDNALCAWFIQQRTSGTPISGPLLQEKAKHFYSQLHTDPQMATSKPRQDGWRNSKLVTALEILASREKNFLQQK